ncbi:MAG: GNAT family N-acetyltransferase [Flavobacteriaceae bacterium]
MILETRRLLITELSVNDAPFIFQLMNDKDWKRFIGDRKIHTLQDAENYLTERLIPSYKNWGFGFYKVVDKNTDESLGISGFVDRDDLEFVDIGFAFLPKGRNKGYALESTQALLFYGTEKLKFTTVLAIANNDNDNSHKLLKKLGFRFQKYIKLNVEEEEISLFTNR